MKNLELTNENLEKALQTFGLSSTLLKANPFLAKPAVETDLEKSNKDDLNKTDAKDALVKALGFSNDDLQKALLVSSKIEEFNASWTKKSEDLQKSLTEASESYNALSQNINEKDTLIKSLSEKNETLTKSLQDLSDKVDSIGTQGNMRKSITNTSFAEKPFEKGVKNENEGKQVLSITKDLQQIKRAVEFALDNELSKGIKDGPFLNGAESFEANKKLTKGMIDAFAKEGIIIQG